MSLYLGVMLHKGWGGKVEVLKMNSIYSKEDNYVTAYFIIV